jgi:hypothetical protein
MHKMEEEELQALLAEGMDYETACGIAGISEKQREAMARSKGIEDLEDSLGALDDMSESALIEVNGGLAIKVVNRALLRGVSGDIDATVLNAAVRAVSMLESKRKDEGDVDVADDILRWVEEQMNADNEAEE